MAATEQPSSGKNSYSASDIEVLEGLEPVRKRPGMYIGGTEGPAGLHHLVREIVDNSIDEAMNGHADKIFVTLHKNGKSVSVEDNGRGIPVDLHPRFKKPALELILTTLHSGGKFSDRNYVSAGGLHGVGSSVVNALSEELVATVWRDGFEWQQKFSQGKAVSKLSKGEKTKKHGTKIFFAPDTTIISIVTFKSEIVRELLQEKAFLNRGLVISFTNETVEGSPVEQFCYPDGLKSHLENVLARKELKPLSGELFTLERGDGIKVDCAFAWTEATSEQVISYVNGIRTHQGGTHEDGFKGGLVKAIRNFLSVHDAAPKNVKIVSEDIREGLVAVLSVNVPGAIAQLQFQGQTKDKLNNPEIEAPVDALLRSFENTLNQKPKIAEALVERISLAARARAAARSAAESISRKVGAAGRLTLPGKLADCSSSKSSECEVFIVEGDSAGGSAKQGRDRRTQAVLPLRGKILNTVAASDGKLKDNQQLLDVVAALGCGLGEGIKVDKLRYGKVIILTDADADGMHIGVLLMAFFYKYMRPLIEQGHLYIGMSPLYRVRFGNGAREQTHWVFSDAEKEELLKKSKSNSTLHITRFKGLGEMNPETLWETTLDPQTRTLLRITIDAARDAEATFEAILGKDASSRFKMIQENAHRLELDL